MTDIRERLLDVIHFTEGANQGTTPDALLDEYRDASSATSEAAGYQRAARDATDLLTGHGPDGEAIVRFLQEQGARLRERSTMLVAAPPATASDPRLAAVLAAVAKASWRVWNFDADQWQSCSAPYDSVDEARWRQRQLAARYPDMPTAIVRESRTYQTEED